MDIMRHKDAVDEIVKTGKAIMNCKNPEEKEILKVKKMIILNLKQSVFIRSDALILIRTKPSSRFLIRPRRRLSWRSMAS